MSNNSFDYNIATVQGGAIYYNIYEPSTQLQNIYGSHNIAPYGAKIAGYPYSIRITSYDQIQIASG